jgi:hypothetical protein
MERVGEHHVPAGPLAVRWLAYELPELRAGAPADVSVRLRNEGSAAWRASIAASYHWLDDRGNPIVWDGWRTPLPSVIDPGEEVVVQLRIRVCMPPGRYRLAFDLLEESRFWFAEIGSCQLEVPATVVPRVERRLGVAIGRAGDRAVTEAALRAQDEPLVTDEPAAVAHLVAGAEPAADWSRRLLDAHAEGFAVVGPALEAHDPALAAWVPSPGRNPAFSHPLLCPSLVRGIEPVTHLGLPAWRPDPGLAAYDEEPWIFDGRIRLRLPRGRRSG